MSRVTTTACLLRAAWIASLLGACLARPADADVGVISANLHRVECTQRDALPVSLAADPNVDALSIHTFGGSGTATSCVVDRAMSAAFSAYGKPKLVASDGGVWTNANASGFIDQVLPAGNPAEHEHYEHYERFFERGQCQQTGDLHEPGPGDDEEDLACIANMPNEGDEAAACGAWRLPMEGQAVSAAAHLPQCPRGTTSNQLRNKLGNRASLTRPNGRLYRNGRDLYWALGAGAGSPVTLMGYSWMGALTGLRFQTDGYLSALKGFGTNGINLTRVWAVEQWTAMQVQCTSGCTRNGLTPFAGNKAAGQRYDLDAPNPVFYRRLRDFVQKAADRGMVVQLSLFDKHGLVEAEAPGRWLDSPYRKLNNSDGFLENDLPCVPNPPPQTGCTRRPRREFVFWNEPTPRIAGIHRAYLARVASEVGATGNVIFELFNEARQADWPDDADTDATSEIEEFQLAVAAELRRLLPAWAARDAFNDETDGTPLDGKLADTGETWWANNARVRVTPATGTRYSLGEVVSQSTGAPSMSAALPIKELDSSRRSASVAANLSRTQGVLAVGFQNGAESLSVQFDGTTYRLRLSTPAGGAQTLASYTPAVAPASTHVRLVLDLVTSRASVYVDSALPAPLDSVWVPALGAPFNQAFLGGWVGSGPYLPSHGSLDNFEASFSCDSGSC